MPFFASHHDLRLHTRTCTDTAIPARARANDLTTNCTRAHRCAHATATGHAMPLANFPYPRFTFPRSRADKTNPPTTPKVPNKLPNAHMAGWHSKIRRCRRPRRRHRSNRISVLTMCTYSSIRDTGFAARGRASALASANDGTRVHAVHSVAVQCRDAAISIMNNTPAECACARSPPPHYY